MRHSNERIAAASRENETLVKVGMERGQCEEKTPIGIDGAEKIRTNDFIM